MQTEDSGRAPASLDKSTAGASERHESAPSSEAARDGAEGGLGGPVTRACCYTIDEGYLLPTLLSASQLRRQLPRACADVVVVCFGEASDFTVAAEALCARDALRFVLVPKAVLDGAPMICARFFLTEILEAQYRDLVYIDGDTQVAGSLEPLLVHAVAPGEILATPDPMAVMIDSPQGGWPARRAYFERLGVPAHRHGRYFNSGVMRFRRTDWESLSRDCLKFCTVRGDTLTFRDQDALNIVVGEAHRPTSFRWNFPSFFMNFGAEAAIAPRVYHFMSNPRPWQGAFAPWGRTWHDPYLAFLADNPALARSLRRTGRLRLAKYAAQQRFKRFVEAREWGIPSVRRRIADMEAEAVV